MPTPEELSSHLDEVLANHPDIPRDVVERMIGVESGGDQAAISPKGARGMMQLMPATAKELGVDPDDWRQNIAGGVRYLDQNYKKFGSLPLAVAAYQAGPGAVEKAGGIPNRSDGINTTRQYVEKVVGPYRGNDSGDREQPKQSKREPKPWDSWPVVTPGMPEPEPEPGSLLADTGRALAAGAAEVPGVIGQGMSYVGRKTGFPGMEPAGDWLKELSDSSSQSWKDAMSPENRTALDNPLITQDWDFGPTPLKTLFLSTVQMIPSMAAMGVGGGLGLKGLQVVAATSRIGRIAELAGAAPATAEAIAGHVARGTAFGGSQGVYMGLQAGAQAEKNVEAMPLDQLKDSPAFQAELEKTDPALPVVRRGEIARKAVAQAMGDQVTGRTMILTGVAGAATGGGVFGQIAHPLDAGLSRRVAQGAAVEAGTLTPQMAGMTYFQNQGMKDFVNPAYDTMTGMPNAIASGVAQGAIFGGAGGAARRGSRPNEAPLEFNREAVPAEGGDNFPTKSESSFTPVSEQAIAPSEPLQSRDTAPMEPAPRRADATPEGDIGRKSDGAPFSNPQAARMAGKSLPDHEVVPVEGGFVLRRKNERPEPVEQPTEAPAEPPATETPPEVVAPAEASKEPTVNTETGEVSLPRSPGMLEGDIGRHDGTPFKNPVGAKGQIERQGLDESHHVVPIEGGGFVIRPKSAEAPKVEPVAAPSEGMQTLVGRPNGEPFANKQAAIRVSRALPGEHEIVPVEGGFKLKPSDDKMPLVDVKFVETDTGRTGTVKMRADEAHTYLSEQLDKAKAVLECLSL